MLACAQSNTCLYELHKKDTSFSFQKEQHLDTKRILKTISMFLSTDMGMLYMLGYMNTCSTTKPLHVEHKRLSWRHIQTVIYVPHTHTHTHTYLMHELTNLARGVLTQKSHYGAFMSREYTYIHTHIHTQKEKGVYTDHKQRLGIII
jgi:hypothetical protein